jgi:hypothetical protein
MNCFRGASVGALCAPHYLSGHIGHISFPISAHSRPHSLLRLPTHSGRCLDPFASQPPPQHLILRVIRRGFTTAPEVSSPTIRPLSRIL